MRAVSNWSRRAVLFWGVCAVGTLSAYDRGMGSPGLERARAKMAAAGVDKTAIEVFAHYYRLLEHGETGLVPEASIDPVDMESLADVEVAADAAAEAIGKTVVIKLNGGLGTSMGY